MTRVTVAPPLIQGDGMYRECLDAILGYTDTVTPTKGSLINYLDREFSMGSNALATRGIQFLCSLDFLEKQSEDLEATYRLAPAGRRYTEHSIPDLLFIQFHRTVRSVPETIQAIDATDGSIASLTEVLEYDRTNCWQRAHWLETMEVITEKNAMCTLTQTGRDLYAAYCDGDLLAQ